MCCCLPSAQKVKKNCKALAVHRLSSHNTNLSILTLLSIKGDWRDAVSLCLRVGWVEGEACAQ
ncbi:hypothetical protein PRUPE_4G005600 [Prunus persica]|uniref:Uncharacterized protein n=1 Tax=Prunus persica TaxID=3760 RepID=A0A251PDQ4_PRUPE|nr:hypothetical protein PRUPE_4G005600 [Prunus persica]